MKKYGTFKKEVSLFDILEYLKGKPDILIGDMQITINNNTPICIDDTDFLESFFDNIVCTYTDVEYNEMAQEGRFGTIDDKLCFLIAFNIKGKEPFKVHFRDGEIKQVSNFRPLDPSRSWAAMAFGTAVIEWKQIGSI